MSENRTIEGVVVKVELMNDEGRTQIRYVGGNSTDDAVAEAERQAREDSGDESWTMNDWGAA